ncbi:MAG: hypothetical protein PHG97_01570 [Candidatus Margulisbacteria bacterium]|nr:hypothetical protein [Candidatus Margulisiibacteriota bacterium]
MSKISSDGPRYCTYPIAKPASSKSFDPEHIDNPFTPGYKAPSVKQSTTSDKFDPDHIPNPFKK